VEVELEVRSGPEENGATKQSARRGTISSQYKEEGGWLKKGVGLRSSDQRVMGGTLGNRSSKGPGVYRGSRRGEKGGPTKRGRTTKMSKT